MGNWHVLKRSLWKGEYRKGEVKEAENKRMDDSKNLTKSG